MTPTRPNSPSTSTITSLWFLSHCCSVNFCYSHCHRDRRYSKIACLLDLPGMESLFILHFLSFPLCPFILQQLQGQRPCLPCISRGNISLVATSYVDQSATRLFSGPINAHSVLFSNNDARVYTVDVPKWLLYSKCLFTADIGIVQQCVEAFQKRIFW